jgi:SAM-dependent methyltransferase
VAASQGYEESAHLYDLFDDKDNIGFFLKYAASAGRVLDVGAGTGRIALPLARAGVRVTCIEPSPAMRHEFEVKRRAAAELRDRIELLEGSAEGFSLESTFPLAILSGCFDHFLDDHERIASLVNIARHLEPRGRLVFDSFLVRMGDSPLKPAGEARKEGFVYKRFVGGRVLPDGTRDTELVFETYRDGILLGRMEVHSLVGVTTREHIHEILAKAGFRVKTEFGNYESAPYRGQDLLIIEAVKV